MDKKILALNGVDFYGWATERFVVVTEAGLGNSDGHKAPHEVLERIARITRDEEFDAIIVQDKNGVGLEKAKWVNALALGKVIVVWNDEPTTTDAAPYRKLGIRYFTSVFKVKECLEKLIQEGVDQYVSELTGISE